LGYQATSRRVRTTIGAAAVLAALCAVIGGAHAASVTTTKVALGDVNPAQGDCATNTKEKGPAVGYVVIKLTASSFEAKIVLKGGTPGAYGVFMQQVPGSCPQGGANGGVLKTNAAGDGQVSATVPRVSGARSFFVQLVPGGSGPAQFTSNRILVAK
jgi:Cu/Zn superoxide dismutase